MSHSELAILFFLQVALILLVVKFVGYLARLIGQPQVIGEMIAGVLLGPTLFGRILPEVQGALFPPGSIPVIYTVSQLGLVLYMFLIGVEFDLGIVRARRRQALAISVAGIAAPFLLGGALALLLIRDASLFDPGMGAFEAFLFIGSAMSITAFPTLARIIQERGLSRTTMGTLSLAAGSVNDAAAWCLLALVIAGFGGDVMVAVSAIGGGALYAVVVIGLVRPLLRRYLAPVVQARGRMDGGVLTLVLLLVMLAAWFTDAVGIYAVFGAFVLGAAMPRGLVADELHRVIHPLAAYFLLPLFFVFSGLQTQLGLVSSGYYLGVAAIVLVVATVGKGVACWAAARLSGESSRDSIVIGTFMNARGLMELILLNIGLEHGMITPTLFAVMVIMTIVTTMMVGPVVDRLLRGVPVPAGAQAGVVGE